MKVLSFCPLEFSLARSIAALVAFCEWQLKLGLELRAAREELGAERFAAWCQDSLPEISLEEIQAAMDYAAWMDANGERTFTA